MEETKPVKQKSIIGWLILCVFELVETMVDFPETFKKNLRKVKSERTDTEKRDDTHDV